MKGLCTYVTLFSIILGTFLPRQGMTQTPDKMSYQAVIRNSDNHLVVSQKIGIQISILQGSISGNAVYIEHHSPTTNSNGLVTIEVGDGTALNGSFGNINWADGPYFIKTETDLNGGSNYTIIGVVQLLAVPYAFYATKAGNGFSGNYSDLNNKPILFDGTWNSLTGKPTFFDGTWNSLVGKPQLAKVASSGDYSDLINKPVFSVSEFGDTLHLSGNKSIIIPGISAANHTKPNPVIDIDGNQYKTIRMGDQIWMAENLKTTKYANGESIETTVPATLDISTEINPKYQWAYDGNESNVAIYGRLYTNYAISDNRNVCPLGWHVPSDAEWTIFTNTLINNGYGIEGIGSSIAYSLAATSGWYSGGTLGSPGYNQSNNNSTGFSITPGGYRSVDGTFTWITKDIFYWTRTESDAIHAYSRQIRSDNPNILSSPIDKNWGHYVRCLKN